MWRSPNRVRCFNLVSTTPRHRSRSRSYTVLQVTLPPLLFPPNFVSENSVVVRYLDLCLRDLEALVSWIHFENPCNSSLSRRETSLNSSSSGLNPCERSFLASKRVRTWSSSPQLMRSLLPRVDDEDDRTLTLLPSSIIKNPTKGGAHPYNLLLLRGSS